MLTTEQVHASIAPDRGIFIEAHPGSGKTTVAAERFGALRFSPAAATDPRAVVATSFTKAATRELRVRILRAWGPPALRWPHRVVTVDTLLRDVLVWLLQHGHITWVGASTDLTVCDNWRGAVQTESTRVQPRVELQERCVVITQQRAAKHGARPTLATFRDALNRGVCTHDEVRAVVLGALDDTELFSRVGERLERTIRALIIDEAFDANELDVAFLDTCLSANVPTTLIGDPWQALYEFRGARPAMVRALAERPGVNSFPLTASFRWKSDEQRELTERLRAGKGVTLASASDDAVDAALADRWKTLWEADERILPLAFGSAKHDLAYAGATLVLGHVTMARLGAHGPFLRDARATLGLADPEVASAAERWAEDSARRLAKQDGYTPKQAYLDMADDLGAIIGRSFPDVHHSRYQYFKWLLPRMASAEPLVMGLTVHQAKGREWDRVAVVLSAKQTEALGAGLQEADAGHRALYVACTRARITTSVWGERPPQLC